MGAGKTTLGRQLAERIGREYVDLDESIESAAGTSIPLIFRDEGEDGFREREARAAEIVRRPGLVVGLGGGAVHSEQVRRLLREHAVTLWLDVDLETALGRVRGTDRPLAQDEARFRELYELRRPLYAEAADARVEDIDGAVLAAAGVHVGLGALDRLEELVPGDGPVALVADAHVAGIHGADAQLALGGRLAAALEVPPGEEAKAPSVLERLWQELPIGRDGTVVALGGGTATDVAGFAAAVYMRGVPWVPVPTTLVGQVDAAIGGKTAIDLPQGKNLVGAFHWPVRTVIDPALLATLPEKERRNGLAEVVKTGLLAGEPLWELPDAEQVRRCAAFKAAVCLRDPEDRGERQILNLGHTFAHALEAAAGYSLSHGEAVALGLTAALELSGLRDEAALVARLLRPVKPRVDLDVAWAALLRDKKGLRGSPRLVLLDAPGRPRTGVELPADDVRAALRGLVAVSA
jgi:3-dehydroquinate synthetase/shikimate kinase